MPGKKRLPIPPFASEREMANQALARLGTHFHVEREVEGVHCSGRPLRIDAVLAPRDPLGWKDAEPRFGVEFKLAHQHSFDTRSFTAWSRQAVDYTHTDWRGHGRLSVFACPSPTSFLAERGGPLLARMLGQFGVGELAPLEREGWALTIHGDHILWSEARGVAGAGRWSLIPRAARPAQ